MDTRTFLVNPLLGHDDDLVAELAAKAIRDPGAYLALADRLEELGEDVQAAGARERFGRIAGAMPADKELPF